MIFNNAVNKKIRLINSRLIKRFGIPPRSKIPPDPVDMLIATILSQNTNDKNSYQAFQKLKERFSSWEEAAAQPRSKIEKIIKIAGLGKQKSAAIKNFLTSLLKEKGRISLDHLKSKNDDYILSRLSSFNGIGIKTASCVLLFSFRRNICPVDTHVHRTLNRIGVVKTTSPDKTFFAVKGKIPDGIAHSFHTNLIRLGREICKPSRPSCLICPLLKICEYKNKNLDKPILHKENNFMLLDNV